MYFKDGDVFLYSDGTKNVLVSKSNETFSNAYIQKARAIDPEVQSHANVSAYNSNGKSLFCQLTKFLFNIHEIQISSNVTQNSVVQSSTGCNHKWGKSHTRNDKLWCSICGDYKDF